MTVFRYQALTVEGGREDGEITAVSQQQALLLLGQRRLSVFDIAQSDGTTVRGKGGRTRFGRQPTVKWRASFYRQLSVLLAAGIPLDRALLTISGQATKVWEVNLLNSIGKGISEGRSLSTVLQTCSERFARFETGILAVGETSGSITPVLQELASTMEKQAEIRSKISSALVYPAFLMALAPLSLVLISSVLVPNIAPLFEATSTPMPFMLRAMVAAHGTVTSSPISSAISAVAAVSFIAWAATRASVQNWMGLQSRNLPFIGHITSTMESSRLCRLLATLLRNGAPLQSALATLETTSSASHVKDALQQVRRAVSSGQKLSVAFAKQTVLAKGTTEMIAVGEETNQLGAMLTYAALSQELESAALIDRLMTLLVPLLTVLMGLLVGGIMLSVMQAILSINQLATQ
jgi:general secretion pathway protein F